MADDGKERALDLLVYGPLGMALYVRDTIPSFLKVFVARGRSELRQQRRDVRDQVRDQVSQARALGRTAMSMGGPRVWGTVEAGLREARHFAEQTLSGLVASGDGPDSRVAPAPLARDEVDTGPVRSTGDPVDLATRRAAAESLAIPDYDELSAPQVVERLEGLSRADLAAVRCYEEGHRGRRTILFKIDQLTS